MSLNISPSLFLRFKSLVRKKPIKKELDITFQYESNNKTTDNNNNHKKHLLLAPALNPEGISMKNLRITINNQKQKLNSSKQKINKPKQKVLNQLDRLNLL